jgi:hypothetical protein
MLHGIMYSKYDVPSIQFYTECIELKAQKISLGTGKLFTFSYQYLYTNFKFYCL